MARSIRTDACAKCLILLDEQSLINCAITIAKSLKSLIRSMIDQTPINYVNTPRRSAEAPGANSGGSTVKAAEALIAWNGDDAKVNGAPAGAVAVGPLLRISEGDVDWTAPYRLSGGASETSRRTMDEQQQKLAVMCEYYKLVFVYGVDPYIAHRAFLMIDEYQQVIKELGCGPDKDEPGHDPEVGYGRATRKKPGYRVFHEGNALHVWPERHSHGL